MKRFIDKLCSSLTNTLYYMTYKKQQKPVTS